MLSPNITTSLHNANLESFSELDEWPVGGGATIYIHILVFVIISWHHEVIQQWNAGNILNRLDSFSICSGNVVKLNNTRKQSTVESNNSERCTPVPSWDIFITFHEIIYSFKIYWIGIAYINDYMDFVWFLLENNFDSLHGRMANQTVGVCFSVWYNFVFRK